MLQTKTTPLLLIFFTAGLLAEQSALKPPTLTVTKTLGVINIDGQFDDNGWIDAAMADGFVEVQPGENISPIVETEAFVTYNDDHLYIGFKAYDDPKNIRANVSKRDRMYRDDFVGILLDTYGDANRAYQLMVNPIGIQGDGQQIGDDDDVSFDMIFASAGTITDKGFQVEMAIPFSSFRFPDKEEQEWRITFFRSQPRDDFRRQMVWTPHDRNNPCQLCQLGYINGIKGIKSKRTFEFLPSIVGSQSGILDSNNVFQNDDPSSDFALGIKIPLGESATAEVAINPDFSQVEADVTQFDVNSAFALSYPERRPFFNEGSDLFTTGGQDWMPMIRPVYTRSINDPSIAIKILGRLGKTDYGIISAKDEETGIVVPFEDWSSIVSVGESLVNILRLKHALNNSSYIGGVLTDKRYSENGSGINIGTDGQYFFNQNWFLDWQAFSSMTNEPDDSLLSADINGYTFDGGKFTSDFDGENFSGHQLFTNLNYNSRNSFFNAFYSERSSTFRLDTGFLSYNYRRNAGTTFTLVKYPSTDLVESYNLSLGTGRVWYYDWDLNEKWLFSAFNIEIKGRRGFHLMFMPTSESFLDTMFTGIHHLSFNYNRNYNEKLSYGVSMSNNLSIIRYIDPPEKGNTRSANIWFRYVPTDRIKINTSFNFNDAKYIDNNSYYYKGQRLRARMTYQFNRYLSFRVIAQYFYQEDFVYTETSKSFDLHPLLSYQPNPFTIFYIGSSHDFDEGPNGYESFDMLHNNRQIFLKFQYLFQTG